MAGAWAAFPRGSTGLRPITGAGLAGSMRAGGPSLPASAPIHSEHVTAMPAPQEEHFSLSLSSPRERRRP